MAEPVTTLEGWFVLHDFRTINWEKWQALSGDERKAAVTELMQLVETYKEIDAARNGSYGQYSVVGHKADLLFLHMRPTVEELNEIKTEFNKTRFADFTETPYSYFSVVELSGYLAEGDADPDTNPYLQKRLKPQLPETKYVCFYPMNKKREGNDNWYMLPMEERRDMMRSHGMIGRNYAGKVTQIITGSVGLDDWEWGVTLYSDDAIQFKKLVYEMRFDEASARYGEFGPFLVGSHLQNADLEKLLLD